MSLKSVSFKQIVSNRKSSFTNQQPQHDLRLLKLAVLRKSYFAEIVFLFRFKIERHHIVENYAD